jgi:hypothetical protein
MVARNRRIELSMTGAWTIRSHPLFGQGAGSGCEQGDDDE